MTNRSVSMPFPSYGANVRGLNTMSDMNYWAKCWILSKSQDFNWAKVFSRTGHLKKFFLTKVTFIIAQTGETSINVKMHFCTYYFLSGNVSFGFFFLTK